MLTCIVALSICLGKAVTAFPERMVAHILNIAARAVKNIRDILDCESVAW